VGVTIAKKIIPMTTGETNLPNKIPNLNQIRFNGVRIFEFKIPKIKKTKEIIKDQTLISPSFNNGNIETIRKNTKKTIPKLLFVPILILLLSKLN
jgi:hypothetical protein